MDSRPPMAIFELLDYIVNEVSPAWFFDLGMYLLLLKKKKKNIHTSQFGKLLSCFHSLDCLGFMIHCVLLCASCPWN